VGIPGVNGFDQDIDHTVAPKANAKILIAVFTSVVRYGDRYHVSHHLASFSKGVAFEATTTDGANPFTVIRDEHARARTAIG
jgi:hypothetical protein